jgi:NarL family two-component system response regulator LiaR
MWRFVRGKTRIPSERILAGVADVTSMDHITVLIVDDHIQVRQGLRTFLSTCLDFEVVGEAGNGAHAIERCRDLRPQVAIVDMVMPGMDGPAVIQGIKDTCPEVHVVALTSFVDAEVASRALAAGASACMSKDAHPDTLVAAIRQTRTARGAADPGATTNGAIWLRPARCLSS